MELKKFTAPAIVEMARSIANELDDGIISLEQLESSLRSFKFRDAYAQYWTVAPRSQQWYRFEQGEWRPAGQSTGILEGPELTSAWLIRRGKGELLSQRSRPELRAASAPEFLQALVQETYRAYDQGEISSVEAHDSLSGFCLLDREGRFWTPGVRTGSWYFFAAERWTRARQAPAPETLLDLQSATERKCANCGTALRADDQFCSRCGTPAPPAEAGMADRIGEAFLEFADRGMGTVPEAVTDPWDPPSSFAETLRQCWVCGRVDVGTHTRCRVCRSVFGATPSFPSASEATPTVKAPFRSPPSSPAYAAPITPTTGGPSPAVSPTPIASPRPMPGRAAGAARPRSSPWRWLIGSGCVLVFLCSVCALAALAFPYAERYFSYFVHLY